MKKWACVGFDVLFHAITEWKWQRIFLNTENYDHEVIRVWLQEYCYGRVVYQAAGFVFEDYDDALIFAIRWNNV